MIGVPIRKRDHEHRRAAGLPCRRGLDPGRPSAPAPGASPARRPRAARSPSIGALRVAVDVGGEPPLLGVDGRVSEQQDARHETERQHQLQQQPRGLAQPSDRVAWSCTASPGEGDADTEQDRRRAGSRGRKHHGEGDAGVVPDRQGWKEEGGRRPHAGTRLRADARAKGLPGCGGHHWGKRDGRPGSERIRAGAGPRPVTRYRALEHRKGRVV